MNIDDPIDLPAPTRPAIWEWFAREKNDETFTAFDKAFPGSASPPNEAMLFDWLARRAHRFARGRNP